MRAAAAAIAGATSQSLRKRLESPFKCSFTFFKAVSLEKEKHISRNFEL
jgi:hypothetical protein